MGDSWRGPGHFETQTVKSAAVYQTYWRLGLCWQLQRGPKEVPSGLCPCEIPIRASKGHTHGATAVVLERMKNGVYT